MLHLKVPLQNSFENLALMGTDWYNDNQYHVVFAVRDLEPRAEVTLLLDKGQGNGLWWAIESVTEDKAYPFRVVMKK